MQQQIDQERAREFAGHLMSIYTDGILSLMVDLGYKTGLFDAAAGGPATSQEIAQRAGLNERYVREWLGALTTGGIFSYDPASHTYSLPPEHAFCLTGDHGLNLASLSQMVAHLGKHVGKIAASFHNGGGVPYSEFRPEFTELMDSFGRRRYNELLISGFLPTAKGLPEQLRKGISVADIGCGSGHCINIMAREYPKSTFTGYDIAEDAIAMGNAEAKEMGLPNARFEVLDVSKLPSEPKFDLITAFDAIHDQVAPATVLQRAGDALAPDGTFFMIDIKASSNVEENVGNPVAPFLYGISVMHCMTVSLAHDGAGLGTVWGEQLARRMLADAGFTSVEVSDAPDPLNSIYVCRK